MGRNKLIKGKCVVCGLHRELAYRGDTGVVCKRCADTESGKQKPEGMK